MTQATTEPTKTDAKAAAITAGFYWFGMLPAVEPVDWPVPTVERDQETGEFHKLAKFSAEQLWTMRASFQKGESRLPIFVAKLRQLTSVAVRGFVFNSHSNEVQWSGGSMNRIPFPGNGKVMERDEVESVIKSAGRHFVRFSQGVQQASAFNTIAAVWDMELGSKPRNMTDDQWDEYKVYHNVDQCPTFNTRTDRLVSEFVYLVKLDVPHQEWPIGEYLRNPNAFHRQVIPGMTREFFAAPPKSIAEMYGKLGG